jgi:hypothetical protein
MNPSLFSYHDLLFLSVLAGLTEQKVPETDIAAHLLRQETASFFRNQTAKVSSFYFIFYRTITHPQPPSHAIITVAERAGNCCGRPQGGAVGQSVSGNGQSVSGNGQSVSGNGLSRIYKYLHLAS